jgi:hypothetical protein
MEDIIDIIVTETTNTIEITAQPNDEIIDVNIIDNREDIVLNVTPTVVEININSLTSNFGVSWGQITGTLSNQTDLNNALALKANLVGGKVPASELPSYVDDVVEVANFAALPATGETGKIYITLDNNKIYRWSGSVYVEIADSTAVWGAITGTLSSQTDLQNALNAKFDDPTGDTTQYIAGDGSLITFPVAGQAGTLVREVRNTTGATLTKGTIVYISGATGNKPTVSKAIATGDATSAQTFGMVQANISNNANGYVVCVGDLGGLDTSGLTEGAQLYLSSTTAGTYTTTKQLAPAHLVYIGVVTRAHPTLGQIEVKIQNGYELDEIHDVAISSLTNNDGLFYESSTDLWKNKSIATVLGYTPANGANYLPLAGGTMTGAIVGTTATFAMSGSGIALGVTGSGTGDAIRITHSSGRALTLNSSGSGFGILINNDTAATSAPFTIQKTGASVITLTDAGAGTFNSSLTASSFIRTGGTSAQFLKANGSVDSTAYLPLTGGTLTGGLNGTFGNFSSYVNAQTIDLSNSSASNALRITHTNGSYHAVSIIATGNSALYASGSVTVIGTIQATSTIIAQAGFSNGAGQSFTLPSSTGTLALTSQLSSYLPLAGGTLTGTLGFNSGFGTSTAAISIYNNTGASASNVALIDFRVNNSFGGNERVAAISASNPNAAGNNGGQLNFLVSANGTGTTPVTALFLTSTGSATFSSSVSIGAGLRLSSNSSEGEIVGTAGRGLKFYTNDGNSNPLNLLTNNTLQIGSTAGYTTISVGQFFSKGGGGMFTANLLSGGFGKHFTMQRNDVNRWHIGVDSSDNFAIINPSDAPIMSLDLGGVLTSNTFKSNVSVGNPTLDSSGSFISLANGAFVDFPSMSGMIIVNNTNTGAVQVFICGGGVTLSLGFVVNSTGAMTHSPGVGGYRFTNNTGSTGTYAFQVFKTRQTA